MGWDLRKAKQDDASIDAFKRGADNDGCVPCMFFYVNAQYQRGNLHLVVPIALVAVARGHMPCVDLLIDCYQQAKPVKAMALSCFWAKTKIELGDTEHTEEGRKKIKKYNATICAGCSDKDSIEYDIRKMWNL